MNIGAKAGVTTDGEQGLESLLAEGWLNERTAHCPGMGGSPATCPGSLCESAVPFCGMDRVLEQT